MLQPLQPLFDPGVKQFVILHPLAKQFEAQAEFPSPCAVLIKLLVE